MDTDRLLGLDRKLTLQLLGVAAGSFLAILGLGLATGATGTVEVTIGDATVHIGRQVVFAIGTGAVLAGATAVAYANDGMVIAWTMAFAPAFGYLVALFDPETSGGVAGVLGQAAFWAIFVATVLGSVGYAAGRALRGRRGEEAADDDALWALLVGRNRATSRQVVVVAAGFFLSTVAVLAVVAVTGTSLAAVPGGGVGAGGALLGLVALAGLQAYYNDGVVLSWTVVFAPTYAFVLHAFAMGSLEPLVVDVFYAAQVAAVVALLVGTGGFLLGAGARRLRVPTHGNGADPA